MFSLPKFIGIGAGPSEMSANLSARARKTLFFGQNGDCNVEIFPLLPSQSAPLNPMVGVPPPLENFQARHDDFNDAHIKDKN
jgi:hypothetical protein